MQKVIPMLAKRMELNAAKADIVRKKIQSTKHALAAIERGIHSAGKKQEVISRLETAIILYQQELRFYEEN